MPTYVYKFIDTGETIEVQQSFSDDALTEAVHPGSGDTLPVKKVFLPVGVTFKGGGFYETDYRSDSYKKSAEADKKSSEPAKTETPASGAAGSTPATPAPAPAVTAAVASSGSEASKPTAKKPEPSAPTKPVKKK